MWLFLAALRCIMSSTLEMLFILATYACTQMSLAIREETF